MDYGSRASGDHLAPTPRFSYTLVRRHVLFRRGCGSTHLDTTAMQWRGSVTAAVRHDRGAVTQRRGIGMATHRASRCCSRRASQLRQPVAPAYGPAHAAPIAPVTASRRSPARAATHVTVQRPPVAAASSIRGPLRLYSSVAAAWQRRGSGVAAAWQRRGSGTAAARQRHGSGTAAARQRRGSGTAAAWQRYDSSVAAALQRYRSGTAAVRQRRGSGVAAASHWDGSGSAAVRHGSGAARQGCGAAAVWQPSRQPVAHGSRASFRASLRASPRCAHRASRRGPARAATHVTVQRPPVAAARGSAFVAAASSIRGPLRLYSGVAAARQRYGSSTAAARQRHCRGAAQQRFGSGAAAATRHGSPSRQPPRQPSRQPVAPAYVPAHAAPIATQPAQQPTLRPSLRPSRQPYLFRPIWNRTDHNTYTQRKCPGCVYDKCDAKRNDIIPHDRMTSN